MPSDDNLATLERSGAQVLVFDAINKDAKGVMVLQQCGKEGLLSVFDNIESLMAIDILTRELFSPPVLYLMHSQLYSTEADYLLQLVLLLDF